MGRLIAALVTLTVAAGCMGAEPSGTIAPRLGDIDGTFEYRAYDANGTLLLTGQVTLAARPDSSLTGTWSIDWAPGADRGIEVGPQVGDGTLAGHVDPEHTLINLNPGWADNNVFLLARDGPAGGLIGTWQYSTLLGPVAGGSFELR